MIAITNDLRIPYVLESERDELKEKQTTWFFRPLVARQVEKARVEAAGDANVFAQRVLTAGLVGWDNLPNSRGELVTFTEFADVTELVPAGQVPELFNQALRVSFLTADEGKASGSPPAS